MKALYIYFYRIGIYLCRCVSLAWPLIGSVSIRVFTLWPYDNFYLIRWQVHTDDLTDFTTPGTFFDS